MKKIFFYIIAIIAVSFTISIMLTKNVETNEVSTEEVEKVENNFIKLLHTETGSVEEIGLESYLYGVVAAEMPASYELEALKAQAVVARTYTKYKQNEKKHEQADICDDSKCCQAWISKENRFARWEEDERESNWQKIVSAVDSTAGKYIIYEGQPINALFHSNSAGKTELPINVWGGNYPYLESVETSGEEAYSTYASEVQISKDELIQKMLEKYPEFTIDFKKDDCMKILEYNESGRVKTLKVGNINLSGVEARTIFGLKSTNFEFLIDGDKIKFSILGYGHGVGLSQSGSDSLAKQGKNFEEIIKHYYKNVEIVE
ncbi:MAG: stage II sporulation protein D [Clostridia bacterium]|nr:stage II sporulation protein D [Clostridia bacterium]